MDLKGRRRSTNIEDLREKPRPPEKPPIYGFPAPDNADWLPTGPSWEARPPVPFERGPIAPFRPKALPLDVLRELIRQR